MGTAKRERQKANRQRSLEMMARDARKKKTKKRLIQAAIIIPAIVLAVYALVFLTTDDDSDTTTGSDPVATVTSDPAVTEASTVAPAEFVYGDGECAPAEKPKKPVRTFTDAPKQCIDTSKTYKAVVETNKGQFTIDLATGRSPGNVNNFVTLARYGYYDGTGCHRIIENFVVQCGRPGEDESAPGYTVADELPAQGDYTEGVVAMANTGQPNSGGGQWFIITGADGAALPPSYTILGAITDGWDTTVADLAALADPEAANGTPPLEEVSIKSVEIIES